MKQERFELFKKQLEEGGYIHVNVDSYFQNENYHYYKPFDKDEEGTPAYQIIFLVWEFNKYLVLPDREREYGVTALVVTQTDDFERIDLSFHIEDTSVRKVELLASDFYYCLLTDLIFEEMKNRKKTKVRRLTKNEVQLVAEMQSKIDFCERFLFELSAVIMSMKYFPILEGEHSNEWTATVHNYVKEKIGG